MQTFVPPSKGDSTWNLALVSLAVSEEKMFEYCEWRNKDGGQSIGILLAHLVSLTAQVS